MEDRSVHPNRALLRSLGFSDEDEVIAVFFHPDNIANVQKGVRYEVHRRTGEVVGGQSVTALTSVMMGVAREAGSVESAAGAPGMFTQRGFGAALERHASRARNMADGTHPSVVTGTVARMNAEVVRRASEQISVAVAANKNYLRDIARPNPVPLEYGTYTSVRGSGNRNIDTTSAF
jgi:hypothetical protein